MNSPAPRPPTINAETAARALCEVFLANADSGDNAANDHLITEMVGRIRTRWRDVDSTPHTRAMPDRTDCGAAARGLDVAP